MREAAADAKTKAQFAAVAPSAPAHEAAVPEASENLGQAAPVFPEAAADPALAPPAPAPVAPAPAIAKKRP